MFENPRRGRQARNFTTNAPKILDLKSSSEQIFSRKLPLGAPEGVCHLDIEDMCVESINHAQLNFVSTVESLHRTAPNWINYSLPGKKKCNKSNISRLATQYSLNLFVKRYNVIVNKHCWIIKHPCRLRINWCIGLERYCPVRHAIKKLLSIIAWENIYVDITFKDNAMGFPGWC